MREIRPRKNKIKLFGLIGVIGLLGFVYFVGFLHGHQNLRFEQGFKPKIVNKELKKPDRVDFSLFWEVWERIQDKFVGKSDPTEMLYGAIKGSLSSLNDPYTVFLKPGEAKKFLENLAGQFEGIGIEIGEKKGKIVIIAPLEGTPADKAGLKPLDQILKIDGEETEDKEIDKIVEKIRGKAGTEVVLTILREGWEEPKDFKIKRAKIKLQNVKLSFQDNIALLKISQFGDDKNTYLKEAKKILEKKPFAIIIDLRNNPGGYLDSSVDFTSLFLEKDKTIVKEVDKKGREKELKTTLEPLLVGYKIVVLINQGSASAAEIVAGALKDYKKAILVGKNTFGKGTVQELEDLPQKTSLRVTIARWITPAGHQINGEGISPDIELERSESDIAAGKDPQLEGAIQEARK